MNSANLVGRLTRDPELRYANNGTAIAKFTLAVDRYKSEADFIRVVAFDKKAEAVANHIRKGQQLGVSGSIKTGKYQKDDGSTVYTTEVYAHSFDFPAKPKENDGPFTPNHVDVDGFETNDEEDFEDLPF